MLDFKHDDHEPNLDLEERFNFKIKKAGSLQILQIYRDNNLLLYVYKLKSIILMIEL